MARNLSKDLRRVVAGVCALTLVSGTVPVQPIAEVINEHLAITASANDATVVRDFIDLYEAVRHDGTGGLIKIGEDIGAEDYLEIETASTIDLNGHTLTLRSIGTYTDLTITDSVGGGKLQLTYSNYGIITNSSNTTLTIESGTIEFTSVNSYGIVPYDGALIINGGTITSAGYSIYRADGGAVTINGGTITGGFYGSGGDLTITGGRFSFDVTGLVAEGTKVTQDGDYWVVGEQQEEQAPFVKTTADTLESDLANNFKPVSQDVVEAWTAENDEALKAELAAVRSSVTTNPYLLVVYGYDNDKYYYKELSGEYIWQYLSTGILGLQKEIGEYGSVIYYATGAQGEEQQEELGTSLEGSSVIVFENSADIAAVVLDNTTLNPETDYDISYKNDFGDNIDKPAKPGTYTAVIKGKGDYKGTVEKKFTIRENNALHTFIAGGEWNLDYFDILQGGDPNIANISKIEALVEISSENTWGMIQVGEGKNLRKDWFNKGGEYLAVGTNGIYTFSWTPETSTAYEDIDYYYGQVLLGAGEAEAGKEIGKLLAYKVTYSNGTDEYVTGNWGYPEIETPGTINAVPGQTLADLALPEDDGGTWAWIAPSATSVGDEGTNVFEAVFMPNDDKYPAMVRNVNVVVEHQHAFTYTAGTGENANKITATCTDSCNITEGLTLSINAENATYNSEAHGATLSTGYNETAFPGTYTIEYYKGNDKLESAPINAGDYTAKVTVGGATASVDYTIAKADITPTVSISDWTYGKTASTPTVSGNPGNGTVTYQYAVKGSTTFSDGVPTDAGDYTVKATIAETANYNGKTVTADFKINKADSSFIAPTAKTGLVYDGNSKELATAGSTSDGKIKYSLDNINWSEDVPTATLAGEYTVRYMVVGDANHNDSDAGYFTVTIAKANIDPTVSIEGWTYGEAASNPTVSGNPGEGQVTYTYARKGSDDFSSEVPTNAGNYTVKATVAETDNYNGGEATADFSIAKAPAPESLTDIQKPTAVEGLVYTGEAQKLINAPEQLPEGYSIRYNVDSTFWISNLPARTEPGTYTVKVKYISDNYTEFTGEDIVVTIKDKYSAPMWTWNDDYTEATATFIKNTDETVTLEADVTKTVVSEPTYSEYGKTVYTASVVLEGKTYTYRKPVITAKLALTHVEATEPTCTEPGNIEYWFDPDAEKYFADAEGENEITEADTIIAAIAHAYGEPQWIWNAENAATATFKCANCDDEQTINAVVTAEVTAPTYTKNGKTVYTATVSFEGETYTDTLTVTIGKKAYVAPTITYKKGDGAVKLSWNAVEGAERYGIVGFSKGEWKFLNKTEDTSFVLENLEAGKEYQVAVVAMFDGQYMTDISNAITVTPKAAETSVYPKITEIEYNEKYHQFKLNWSEVPNAENYGIAVYLAGKWKIVDQTIPATETSFTSPKLKAGSTYKMLVAAKVNGKWDLSALSSRAFEVTVK